MSTGTKSSFVTKLKAVFWVSVLLSAAVFAMGQFGGGNGTEPDINERRVYELVGKSSEEYVHITADVVSSTDGQVISLTRERKNEPWHIEFAADPGETVEITLIVMATGPRVKGYKVFSRCEIYLNGTRIKMDRDEIQIGDFDIRSTYTECHHKG